MLQEPYTIRVRTVFALLLGIALLSGLAFCQATANIVGTVTDPTGSAVPNAKVTVTNTATGIVRAITTNVTGNFAARELAIGRYNVRWRRRALRPSNGPALPST